MAKIWGRLWLNLLILFWGLAYGGVNIIQLLNGDPDFSWMTVAVVNWAFQGQVTYKGLYLWKELLYNIIYIFTYTYLYIYIHMICMYIYIINRGFSTGFNFPKERTLRVQTFWRYSLHSSWPDKSSMGRFKGKTETRTLCFFIILNKAIRIKDSFQCFQEIFIDGI
jgi:hypothetical protein